jgi:hypothetical protein
MQQHVLSRPVADLHGFPQLLMAAMLIPALIQPLALAYRMVRMASSAPATSEAPSLAAQLQGLFPTLAGHLAARAEFRSATRTADGQTLYEFAPTLAHRVSPAV